MVKDWCFYPKIGNKRKMSTLTTAIQHRTESAAAAAAKSHQSCPTLCSPPGSPVPGILQARTLKVLVIIIRQNKQIKENERYTD